MPITPLHFGLLAPVNHWFPGKVSMMAFVLVNLWIDHEAILFFGLGVELADGDGLHGVGSHSFLAALAWTSLFCLFKPRTSAWILGTYLGGISHILLDMLVHSDMTPFYPWIEGNPMNLDLLMPLSIVLLPLFAWWLIQCMRNARYPWRTNPEVPAALPASPYLTAIPVVVLTCLALRPYLPL